MQLYPYVQSDLGDTFPSWATAKERASVESVPNGAQALRLPNGGSIQNLNCNILPQAGMHEGDICKIYRLDPYDMTWYQYRDRGWRHLVGNDRVPEPPLVEGLSLPPEATFSQVYAMLERIRPFQLTERSAQQFVEALRRTETDRQGGLIPWRDDDNEYRVVFMPGKDGEPGVLKVWLRHSVGRFIGAEGKHIRAIQRRLQARVRYIEAKSFEEE